MALLVNLRVLHLDTDIVVIDKPAGFHVHPPENRLNRISNHQNCLWILNRQLERHLYPVHRLDVPTSGALLYALSSEAASQMARLFRDRQIHKRYVCLVRGYVDDVFDIENEDGQTKFRCIYRAEKPFPTDRYQTTRLSFVEAVPITGKHHQIRRHLSTLRHPIVGDREHGDRHINRFFKETLELNGLFLKAYQLDFTHPMSGEPISCQSRWDNRWHQVFDWVGICPFL